MCLRYWKGRRREHEHPEADPFPTLFSYSTSSRLHFQHPCPSGCPNHGWSSSCHSIYRGTKTLSSSSQTPIALDGRASAADPHCTSQFLLRQRIMDRDGPRLPSHLIPFSKGNEYIHRIIQSRMGSQFDISIDDIENGIFVSRNLHKALGSLMIAFLKTPNFAMEVGDVPAILVDPLSSIRITMQYIGGFPTREPFPLPELDAKIGGNGASQPSVLLLDYVYGVAIFRRWGSVGPYRQVLREYAQANLLPALEIIPHPATPSQTSSHTEPDDPDDADFDPDLWEPDALQAMDDMLLLSLLLKGAISESQHEAMQKVCDEEQAVSTQKVEEWRNIT
ncbi:hypothetical protein BS47DRAFT_1338342, partial [Hydnum rufescens UP504]